MYNKKYNRRYSTRNSDDKNVFDDAEKLGNLVIKAHEKGGMPLLLAVIGVVCLVITVFFVFINTPKIWPILFFIIALFLFAFSIYLHLNKKKELCPKCGKELIKKLKNGKYFLACPGYPECRFTKSLY